MRTFSLAVAATCVLSAGCSPQPKVTTGTFNDSYELTMQRGAMDVVVQTSGPATYTVTNYAMSHPMGPRPNTEAVFVTPAGTFKVSSNGDNDLGVIVNGVLYPEPPDRTGRSQVVIDAQGSVSVRATPPSEPVNDQVPEPRPARPATNR